MKNNSARIERLKIMLISIALLLILALEINKLFVQSKYNGYNITKYVEVTHNGKLVYKGDIDYYKMKNVKDEDNLEMKMHIPENNIVNPAIIYDNINTGVKIYLDGKKIYPIGEDTPKGGIVCHFNNKVALGEAKKGKEDGPRRDRGQGGAVPGKRAGNRDNINPYFPGGRTCPDRGQSRPAPGRRIRTQAIVPDLPPVTPESVQT